MKIMKNFRIEESIIKKIKQLAEEDHRSTTGEIEFILLEYIRAREIADKN